jgi:hypothetical protein
VISSYEKYIKQKNGSFILLVKILNVLNNPKTCVVVFCFLPALLKLDSYLSSIKAIFVVAYHKSEFSQPLYNLEKLLTTGNHNISFICLEEIMSQQVSFPGHFNLFPGKNVLQGNYFQMLEMLWLRVNKISLLGQKIKNTARVHIFPLPLHVFVLFLELYLKPLMKNLPVKPLICCAHSSLTSRFSFGASK